MERQVFPNSTEEWILLVTVITLILIALVPGASPFA